MIITAETLRSRGACSDEREAFAKMFPQGTDVTLESATACASAGLDLSWFAGAFLSPAALATYEAAKAAAWATYEAATAAAWATCEAATAPAMATCGAASAAALVKAWDEGRGVRP